MKRYHKKVYFPFGSRTALRKFTDKLNAIQWQYTSHALDNLKYRAIDKRNLLLFIKSLILDCSDVFEFYAIDNQIVKACYRIYYNEDIDIILVLSNNKKIITIYLNEKSDLHYTLNEAQYNKS